MLNKTPAPLLSTASAGGATPTVRPSNGYDEFKSTEQLRHAWPRLETLRISPGHIHHVISSEADAVRELLAPALPQAWEGFPTPAHPHLSLIQGLKQSLVLLGFSYMRGESSAASQESTCNHLQDLSAHPQNRWSLTMRKASMTPDLCLESEKTSVQTWSVQSCTCRAS